MECRAVTQQFKIQGISGRVVGDGLCLNRFVKVEIGMFIRRTVKIFLAIRLYSTKISSIKCKERTCFLWSKSSIDSTL